MSKQIDELYFLEALEKYKARFNESPSFDLRTDTILKEKKILAVMMKVAVATGVPINENDLYEGAWFRYPPTDKPKIKEGATNYDIDKVISENGYREVAALTKKNADFIEAIIKLDSNYGTDTVIEVPEYGFDPVRDVSSSKKSCGSIRYWFTFMKNNHSQRDYETSIRGAIIAIDRTNSTHLESAVNGRETMAKTVLERCPNYKTFIDTIQQPFDLCSAIPHLLYELSKPIKAKKKGTERCNVSFASKFLSYAAQYLLEGDEKYIYSKYDSVVSEKLPDYVYVYLGEEKKTKWYKANGNKKPFEIKMMIYEEYCKDIQRILNRPDVKKAGINKNTFDHIVWYCNK